jgi:hypothetical protein
MRNLPGPRNVLLKNVGGLFEEVSDPAATPWVNTYQATWADVDDDRDPDLYLANDFAPNRLLRNDSGRFVDVTQESGTADLGFSMGASFSDFDGDGRLDLYVSNMESNAGQRLMDAIPGVDPRYRKMAAGNSLLRNIDGQRFERVAGGERAGWSWGGHFVDIDLDGREDLHVPAGYYTAPEAVALPVDT